MIRLTESSIYLIINFSIFGNSLLTGFPWRSGDAAAYLNAATTYTPSLFEVKQNSLFDNDRFLIMDGSGR